MLLLTIAGIAIGAVIVIVLLLTSGILDRDQSREIAQGEVARPAELVDGRAVGVAPAPHPPGGGGAAARPAWGVFTRSMEPRLIEEYVVPGRVRLVYRDMAFLGQESLDAAVGARAAEQLLGNGGFWRFHDLLFHNQDGENEGAFNRTVLGDMAVSLGMDRTEFVRLLDDPQLIAAVRDETREGQQSGISSTPTLNVNGQHVVGLPTWDRLAEFLDGLLAGATPGIGG